jgi:DNA polymerase I
MNELIYGKNPLERIVSIEVQHNDATIFRELEDGTVVTETVPACYYLLFADHLNSKMRKLAGDQHYKYILEYNSYEKYAQVLKQCYNRRYDMHVIRDAKEAMMIKDGYTYFKGMKLEDVSVLSFDIETNGLTHDDNSKVFIISNTFRKRGQVTRKLFALDDFDNNQSAMLKAWVKWVQEVDPSVVVGHNLYGFDLPYLQHVSELVNSPLRLGRDQLPIRFNSRKSQFRKDGSQAYDYFNAYIFGREIVDTYFLALKYDVGRKYESYGLKQIIAQEGLERKDRVHFQAGTIGKNWNDSEKRNLIKKYAEQDADDALKLYDLMIPSLFYYTQSVPRSFQQIINSATGSQINSLMVRAYLQQGHSIAKGSEAVEYPGAISHGNPGVHKNVWRLDVASLYPSVIRQYKIYCKAKDPQALLLKLVNYFTEERLNNKRLGKETGDRYYKDLEQAQKIVINSIYGALGAPKLNYNYPKGAAQVTEHGRRILQQAIEFTTGRELDIA